MKINLLYLSLILSMFLSGCVDFATGGGSVWQAGMWIVPVLTGLGVVYFGYKTYKIKKNNISLYQIGEFYYSLALIVATILIILNVVNNK